MYEDSLASLAHFEVHKLYDGIQLNTQQHIFLKHTV